MNLPVNRAGSSGAYINFFFLSFSTFVKCLVFSFQSLKNHNLGGDDLRYHSDI